ncbi:MAG: efflux RND transporter permease subunit, partial [bacterium]
MSLSRRVVNRPTTFLIIFALLVGFGLYVATDMAIDLFPDIEPPILVVFANYSGAGPEEVEQTVTRPMESALSNVSNIDRISSTSTEGSSQVMIEFTYGTDMSEASNDVRDKLEFVRDALPDEVTSPMIFKFDPALLPILYLQVTANRSPEDLRQLAVDTIAPRIEQIDGVALASVDGGREKVIRVDVPQNRLEAYDLNLTQIQNIIRGNNMQVSAGNITEGNIKYLVRTSGEFTAVDELKNTVVAYKGSPPTPQKPDSAMVAVRLRDIADVYEGYRDPDSLVYVNGEPGVFVIVQKQSGTNSVQVADTVIAEMAEIEKSLPSGVDLVVRSNTTEIVKDSLESVSSSAILGGILAVIILFVFLRSIKSTLLVAVAIPVSLVLTLMFMYFFDLTLNLMTLTGLALGVGMLVDNSIVIIENIYRYREKGAKLHASAILGSQEMTTAITASTLTTVLVFLPMVVFRNRLDFIGEMISGLALTVVISL